MTRIHHTFFILTLFLIPLTGKTQTDTLFVNGLCGMCKDRIEEASLSVKGVVTADWTIDTRTLVVTTKPKRYQADRLHEALNEAGHDTGLSKASDEAYASLHDCCLYRDPFLMHMHQDDGKLVRFFVDGICGMCKDRIEEAALSLDGVEAAEWNIKKRELVVFSPDSAFDESLIHRAVNAAGHDTELSKAPDEAYASLHDCCKYRDPAVVAEHRPKPQLPAQVRGRIMVEEAGDEKPLEGVQLYWVGAQVSTYTDEAGEYTLERPEGANQLVASYVGYYTDTITLDKETTVDLTLERGIDLDGVEVTYQRKSVEVSFINPILTQNISSQELLKAACCTLAESFETNPAVDVSFTDAVTGARQIEMLGLAGPYMQITRENIPDVRGLAAIYGLVYLPGPWVESIQLAKGAGSVVNGFESITGQINVELKKPEAGEDLYLNLYANEGGRFEANANARVDLGEKWSTSVLVHADAREAQMDRNGDDFLDMPTGNGFTLANRWKYQGTDGWAGQFGVKVTNLDKISGQLDFDEEAVNPTAWGAKLLTKRLEGWAKIGKVFQNRPDASIGFQVSGLTHDQDATFGGTRYDADQRSAYANLIYSDELGDPAHLLKTGLSYQYDQYDEWLGETLFEREEKVPGGFMEYTYQPNENFTAVAGLRGDHHNQFGFFLTPRVHLRYALSDKSVVRFSGGSGRRTASVIAENLGMLASSRAITIQRTNSETPYGLNQEVAWNLGVNLRQTFIINNRELILTLDGYHTRFDQQIVVDYDQTPREVRFYNLDGRSYSNAVQAQLDYAVLKNLDLRMAYRFNDVRTDYEQGRLERPFVSRHRAFVNAGYKTDSDWAFDLTVNWQGSKRIPSTEANPEAFQMDGRSPDFFLTNAQVSKTFGGNFDVYLGVENLFGVVQENPILGAEDPFGTYFDSSLIWGPIFGRTTYLGVRYTLGASE
jgi:copper chaperone CopZ/outer membrane cobalamin receptor